MVERVILRKVKNLKELVLDMESTPNYILDSVDWDVVKGVHNTYKYVNQIGISITSTSIGSRPVGITGWIVADDELHMALLKRELNMFVNPQEEIDLIYNDYTIRFKPDESIRYSLSYEENNEIFAKFKITGTCANPLFEDINESQIAFVTTIKMFHFPLIISKELPEGGVVFGKRMESLIVNIVNKGSVQVGMRIVIKANGTVVNPKIVNINTQQEFLLNKTLVSGEEVVINTNTGKKSVKGKIGNEEYSNYYMYKDFNSKWLKLDVGDNLFRYDAEQGIENMDVFVYFANNFLEVQECR